MATYSLVGMKPNAAAVTKQLGEQFGIRTIYGFNAASVPEHSSGTAADFMIDNLGPNGKAIGDALANHVVANAATYRPKNVIWNRRIWSAARASEGWRPYSGTPNPHTDHVHIWFSEEGTVGMPVNFPNGVTPLGFPGQGALDALEKLSSIITRKDFWYRVGVFTAGLILVLFVIQKTTGAANLIPMGRVAKAVKLAKGAQSG